MVETALEKAEHRSRVRAATTIQKYIRGYRFRTRNSTIMRDINIRVHNSIRNVYARKIQRVYRGKLVRDKLQSMTAAAMVIQGYFRAKWMQESFHDLRNDVIMIQRAFRAYLTWKRIVKERLERFLGQEYALMHNLRLLENSELFSTVSPTNIPPHIQQAYKTLSSIAATNAASNQAQLAQMGSISKQTLPANPFHIERMYFFTRVLDLDLLTDVSLIYEPLWSQQFEQLTNDCLEHEELMMELGVGGAHSGAITARGRVFMWGWNDKGQCLGNGRKPRLVEQFKDKRIVQLSCGDDHSLSLDSSGSVWAFGENTKGQLGQGHYREVKEPVQVQVPPTRQVAATGGQCFAVTRSNELYMWPFETKHREKRSHPIRVMSELLVSEVAVGYNFALILVTSGQVYSYGINNSEGQLGHGDTEPRTAPALIESLKKEKVAGVSCGFRHSIARSTLGRVFTWGWGGRGQLGHNNYHSQHSPQILLVKGQRVKAIQASAGHKHSVLMLENRKIVWFGTNSEIADVCVPIEANLAVKLPEFFTKNSDFNVVKVQCVWSRSLSLTMITIADLRYLKVPKIKLANSLGLLCTKWTSNTIEPPSVEALAQFYPTVAIKRGSPLKQRRDDLKERTRSILSRPEDRWTPEERSIIEKTQRK